MSNLPPGVSQRDIDSYYGFDGPPEPDDDEDDEEQDEEEDEE